MKRLYSLVTFQGQVHLRIDESDVPLLSSEAEGEGQSVRHHVKQHLLYSVVAPQSFKDAELRDLNILYLLMCNSHLL